jgi:hypothetical protein
MILLFSIPAETKLFEFHSSSTLLPKSKFTFFILPPAPIVSHTKYCTFWYCTTSVKSRGNFHFHTKAKVVKLLIPKIPPESHLLTDYFFLFVRNELPYSLSFSIYFLVYKHLQGRWRLRHKFCFRGVRFVMGENISTFAQRVASLCWNITNASFCRKILLIFITDC